VIQVVRPVKIIGGSSMKRALCLVLLLLMVSFSMIFANGNQDLSDGKVEITYWYPWGHVNAVYVPPDGGIANGKLLAAVAGGKAPDVVVSNVASLSYTLATQGALEKMDDALKVAGFDQSELLEPFKGLMQYKGDTYIFPHDTNISLLYYNADMFREAGLDPDKPPRTIEELDAYSDKLSKVNSSGDIERMGFIPWIDGNAEDPLLMGYLFGTDFYNAETNKLNLTGPHLAELFSWIGEYAKKFDPERIQGFAKGFGGAFSPDHPFFNGRVAMTVNGNWFTNALRLYAPDIDYRVAAIPTPPGGRTGASTFGTNVFLMPKGAKEKEDAVKFMLFASQPEISADNINTWRSLSVWKRESDAVKWYENDDPSYKLILEIAIRDRVIYAGVDPAPLLADLQKKLQVELDKQ
jgi:multiple sugar transport system substrate-binding protein